MKNKIGWCDLTFNPVWGCRNHCEYCYARKIAKRFWKKMYMYEFNYYYKKHPNWVWTGDQLGGLWKFEPTFLESQFERKFPKKPQRIFVGSMSEIYYWKKEWIEEVIEKVKQYPQHTFQFLTRYPEVYDRYVFPKNCWLGVTITKEEDFDKQNNSFYFYNGNHITFFSFEPVLESIDTQCLKNSYIDWVILGAETGNRKDKVIPKREWVSDIVGYCVLNKIPYYLKDNLSKYYGGYRGYKQFPKGGEIN